MAEDRKWVQKSVEVERAPSRVGGRAAVRYLLLFALVLLAIWMISPMFTSTYVEAYVARLQSMAILNHQGHLALDDQAYPINSELLYVTRLGMVWLLQGAMALFHSTESWVLRIVTIASFVLLVASSAVFARRWSIAPVWAVVACAILTPGVLEPSFFFADNLESAALTSLALALVTARVTALRWIGIGAIVACAMLVRLDAVLMAPAIVAVLWLATLNLKRTTLAVLFGLVGAALIFALSYEVTSVSMIQAYHVGQLFSQLNNNPNIYQTGLMKTRFLIFFGFFGLISLPLIVIGAWRNYITHVRSWSVVMTAVPLLFYIAVIPHANEIRDFCIMGAPFVLLHAATGLKVVDGWATGPANTHKPIVVALFCFFAVVLFAPPYISMRDGPRVLIGRIYNPIFWRQWQGRTSGMVDDIRSMVKQVKPGQTSLVISSQFEPDRYLHLRLLQEGFRIDPVSNAPQACQSIETFDKEGRKVVAIRTENPYGIFTGPSDSDHLEALQIVDSLHCLAGQHFARTYFLSIGKSGEPYWPALAGPEIEIPGHFPLPILHHASYGFLGEIPLTPADIALLQDEAQRSLIRSALAAHAPVDEARFRAAVQHRFWTPSQ